MDTPVTQAVPRTAAALRAVPMGLYPTLNSLEEVVTLAKSSVSPSECLAVVSLLFTYHNTLLKAITHEPATLQG